MTGEYTKYKCPECGSKMFVKNETKTFDGTVVVSICENCGYVTNYEK